MRGRKAMEICWTQRQQWVLEEIVGRATSSQRDVRRTAVIGDSAEVDRLAADSLAPVPAGVPNVRSSGAFLRFGLGLEFRDMAVGSKEERLHRGRTGELRRKRTRRNTPWAISSAG